MATMKDKVEKALSEARTLVVGAQILLGFQYQALFRPGFEALPAHGKRLEGIAFALLLVAIGCLVAPASFHRVSERGRATRRQYAFTTAMNLTALVPIALAVGANVMIATETHLGAATTRALALGTIALCLFLWFGLGIMRRLRSAPRPEAAEPDATPSLSERIKELLQETRIVLPGVQALLGFQFAAFLSEAFARLPPTAKAVHTASLMLLALAMILLMTPAPYRHLAEDGRDTPAVERVGSAFVLAALIPLALGLAGDFFVVLDKAGGGATPWAGAGAAVALLVTFALWFGVPLLARLRRGEHPAPPSLPTTPPRAAPDPRR